MRNIFSSPWPWLWSVLAIGVLGCGSSQPKPQSAASSAPPPAAQPAHAHGHMHGHGHAHAQMCPMMKMAGAKVAVSDTTDGVAIAFTTSGDPAELRAHVRQMADMHNNMAGKPHHHHMHGEAGEGHPHAGMGHGGMHAGKEMHMVPSRASVEDLPDGARLVLVPNDPAQLPALRAQAREHAAMMAKGECPMMGPMPQGPPPQATGAPGVSQLQPATRAWSASAAACTTRSCRIVRAPR